jgi:hypothetical protein
MLLKVEEAEAADIQEAAEAAAAIERKKDGGKLGKSTSAKLPPLASNDLYNQARRMFSSPTSSPNHKQISPLGAEEVAGAAETVVLAPKVVSPENRFVYAVTKQPGGVNEVFARLASGRYIDRACFKEALVVLSLEFKPQQRRKLFRKINSNGTQLINLSEFSCFIAQRPEYAMTPFGEQPAYENTVLLTGLGCQRSREGKYEMKGRIDTRPYYQSGDNFLYPATGKWFIGPTLCSTSAYGLYTKDRAGSPLGIRSHWKAWNGQGWQEQTGLTIVSADEETEEIDTAEHNFDDKEARWHQALVRHLSQRVAAVLISTWIDRSPGSYRVNHTSRRTMIFTVVGNSAIVLSISACIGVAMVAFYNACSTTVCADVVVGISYALCVGLLGFCFFVVWGVYLNSLQEEKKREAEDRHQKNLASAAGARMEGQIAD